MGMVNKLNIAFDMFFSKTEAMSRGIGRYSKNLIQALVMEEQEHSYYYFYPDLTKGPDFLKEQLQQFLTRNRIELFHMMSPFYLFHLSPQLFHLYSGSILKREWFGQTRVAATLYDLIPLVFPERYLSDEVRSVYMDTLELIRSCDVIFAISETTKRDAVHLAGLDPNKIRVVMAGSDPQFEPRLHTDQAGLSARYGIDRPYVLCTGGNDFRKNMDRLIEAFFRTNSLFGSEYQLVLACRVSDEERQLYESAAGRWGGASRLVVAGYVPDDDLVQLYNGAALVAFPSLYEGFGLPVLEAMACGTPVLTSNNSSLKEISGEAAYLVDPESVDQIAVGLYKMIADPELRAKLSKAGAGQAAKFNWQQVARKVVNGYEFVCRRKVAVFPLMPEKREGAAAMMETIMPVLAGRVDMDCYIDDGCEERMGPLRGIPGMRMYNHRLFEGKADKYDAILYELSNDPACLYMLDTICRYPGVVILHDGNLHDLTDQWTIQRNDLELYFRVLEKNYGSDTPDVLDSVLGKGMDRSSFPVNRYYLERARAIITHSDYVRQQLADQGLSCIMTANVPIRQPESYTRAGRSEFAFASWPSSRNDGIETAALRALRHMIAIGHRNVKYRIFGTFDPDRELGLKALVTDLQLDDYVEFTGELPEDQYVRKLQETDVAVQLRHSGDDTTAYAAMEAMAYGVPAIVTDTDGSSIIPADVSFKIALGDGFEKRVLNAMLEACGNEMLRQAMSEQARAYIARSHSVHAYAGTVMEAIRTDASDPDIPSVIWRDKETYNGCPLFQVADSHEEAAELQPAAGLPAMASAAEARKAPALPVVTLKPNRLRKVKRGKRTVTYVSFNMAEVPLHAVIQHAILRFSARKSSVVPIYRIRKSWSEAGAVRKRPVICRKPVVLSKKRKSGTIQWECTKWACEWQKNNAGNHGLYVPIGATPVLQLRFQ